VTKAAITKSSDFKYLSSWSGTLRGRRTKSEHVDSQTHYWRQRTSTLISGASGITKPDRGQLPLGTLKMRRWALSVCILAATASHGFDAGVSPILSFDQQSFADSDATQENPDDLYPAVFPLLTNPHGNGLEKQFIWNSTRHLYISSVTLYANLSSSSMPVQVKQWINPSGTTAGGSESSSSGGSMSYTTTSSATGIVIGGQVGSGDTGPQISTTMAPLVTVSGTSSTSNMIGRGVRHSRESRLVAADHQEFAARLNLTGMNCCSMCSHSSTMKRAIR
jgi:hypothetical protein